MAGAAPVKQFIDYIPLLAFFAVWAMDERMVEVAGLRREVGGIYSAAEFLLAASVLVYGSLYLARRRLDKFQWITLAAVVAFCIPTVVLRDVNFLKWKAPAVNWLFACVFLATGLLGEKPAIEHMMEHAVKAPRAVWRRLNTLWVCFFAALGAINLIVAYALSEAVWIQFKVFGNLTLTLLFVLGQMPLLARHIETGGGAPDGRRQAERAGTGEPAPSPPPMHPPGSDA